MTYLFEEAHAFFAVYDVLGLADAAMDSDVYRREPFKMSTTAFRVWFGRLHHDRFVSSKRVTMSYYANCGNIVLIEVQR